MVAIISDIHDNMACLGMFLDWCEREKINTLICCGDVTNIDTLSHIVRSFKGQIHLVRGNMDVFEDDALGKFQKNENFHYYGRTGRLEAAGMQIGICHEPFLIDEVLMLGKCCFVFYGHTHKPWIESRNGAIIANPGTLGGVFQKATFAYAENSRLKLMLLDATRSE